MFCIICKVIPNLVTNHRTLALLLPKICVFLTGDRGLLCQLYVNPYSKILQRRVLSALRNIQTMQQRRGTGSGSLATQGWARSPPHSSPKESTLCFLTTAFSLTLFLISKFQKCLWVKTLSFLIHLLFTYMITGVINIQTVFQLLAFLISFFIRRNESTSWNIFVIPLWIVYGISQGTRSFFQYERVNILY